MFATCGKPIPRTPFTGDYKAFTSRLSGTARRDEVSSYVVRNSTLVLLLLLLGPLEDVDGFLGGVRVVPLGRGHHLVEQLLEFFRQTGQPGKAKRPGSA